MCFFLDVWKVLLCVFVHVPSVVAPQNNNFENANVLTFWFTHKWVRVLPSLWAVCT